MQILKHKKLSFLIKTCICHQKVVILQRKINEHLISYHKKGKRLYHQMIANFKELIF